MTEATENLGGAGHGWPLLNQGAHISIAEHVARADDHDRRFPQLVVNLNHSDAAAIDQNQTNARAVSGSARRWQRNRNIARGRCRAGRATATAPHRTGSREVLEFEAITPG
jgi:hypothetical protein